MGGIRWPNVWWMPVPPHFGMMQVDEAASPAWPLAQGYDGYGALKRTRSSFSPRIT